MKRIHSYSVEVNSGVLNAHGIKVLGGGDKTADSFTFSVTQGGSAATLTGATVRGLFVRPDEATVYITGTVSGSDVTVTLTEACYAYAGQFQLAVKLELDSDKITIAVLTGTITETDTALVVNDGGTYSLTELTALIGAKVNEPATEGTSGYVLTTDGNGGRTWQDNAASTVAGTLLVDSTYYTIRTGTTGAAGYFTIVAED